jgi:ribonuclease PH
MTRTNGRPPTQLRPITFDLHYTRWAEGSVLVKFGETHVLCNVTVENTLPTWLRNAVEPHGWLTAEYALLPRSTHRRSQREQRWPSGRTQEISRLIGRSLRMGLDLVHLGERTLIVDCDVLQADGGTRTAAISGGWVAVCLALRPLIENREAPSNVIRKQIAAVSVGMVGGVPLLDLDYQEDVAAAVDCNVVMTAGGELVEVQMTAEKAAVPRLLFDELLDLAAAGVGRIVELQKQSLGSG